MIKNLLKTLVLLPVIVLSFFLGSYLLDFSTTWKVMLFALYCWAAGQAVYRLFGIIDKRWKV